MAKWVIDDSTLTDIADAIREKKGTVGTIAVDELSAEIATIPIGEDYYTKHIPLTAASDTIFNSVSSIMNIEHDDTTIVLTQATSRYNVAIVDKFDRSIKTLLSPGPLGSDATDLPADMTEFYDSGNDFYPRNVTQSDTHWIVSFRYSAGISADGTHLFGGVVFINKVTKTVDKSYWLPYIISRVHYNKGILAICCQMAGIGFYSVTGTTISELATFAYDQSTGSPTKGYDSQNGCFYSTPDGHDYYANAGFGNGIEFYDVTDSSNISKVAEYIFRQHVSPYHPTSGIHTYTSVVRYPYLYLTIAKGDKTEAHSDLDGVLTLDISDLANIRAIHFEHVSVTDAEAWNGGADTKPTEMAMTQGMLYLNYEHGYLAFEIDATGRSTHYCGKYAENIIYGIDTEPYGGLYAGYMDGENKSVLKEYAEHIERNITKNLTNVTINNPVSIVDNGASYSATLTIDSGYTLNSISIMMGGVDITITAYNVSTQTISIASVTANVSITATAQVVTNYYWQPSDATINQYQASKPATLTVNDNDISMYIPQNNSGFKTTKAIVPPTGNLKLTLKADTATVTQPAQTKDVIFAIKFLDANGGKLKDINFISSYATAYIEDVVNGVSRTVNYSDIQNATQIQVNCRGDATDGAEHYPISIAFTNLRIEVE